MQIGVWENKVPVFDVKDMYGLNQLVGYVKLINAETGTVLFRGQSKLLQGKNAGKAAYAFVLIILLILGYCVYSGIVAIQNWIIALPQHVKIVVPNLFFGAIIIVTIFYLLKKHKENKKDKERNLRDKGGQK